MIGMRIHLNPRQYLEMEKIALGAFSPLAGFMGKEEFESVVEDMRLPGGQVFPLPVVLDLPAEVARRLPFGEPIGLDFQGIEAGEFIPREVFQCPKDSVCEKVFQTRDRRHPGVDHFHKLGDSFAGGPIRLLQRVRFDFSDLEWTPEECRDYFRRKGWKTVVGFQTRNVPHRSHEYLLRLALELADGLFIQPLVGRKKSGDYTPQAILKSYQTLIENFLPRERILLGVLSTAMRYAGPREALFHALIRRNYGCTHFIVGRDHAGVGEHYGKYEAQELAGRFEKELGIQILRFCGPFYCEVCGGIVTERTCSHFRMGKQVAREVNGTDIRRALLEGRPCPSELIRPEILESARTVSLFIEEEED